MTFETVFDAADLGSTDWWFPAAGPIGVAFGALLVFRPDVLEDILPGRLPRRAQVIAHWCIFVFALFWTDGAFVLACRDYVTVSYDLDHKRYDVVEGPVMDFAPMPDSGHRYESFSVQGRRFSCSDSNLTSGFHTTASQGGPIHEGLYIRVTFAGNLIPRLEVRQ